MPRKKIEGICSVEDCGKPIDSKGYCTNHYMRQYLYGRSNKINNGDKRNHPLYIIWWQRKNDGYLSEEWLDFKNFLRDVEPKPDGNYFLVRIRNEPFGPDNFKWQEHLKRKEDESKKDWWARKRAARIAANPAMESDRSIKRKYGLTRDQYNEKLKFQDFVCAICKEPETSVDPRTGTLKSLAVDHCHKHKGIRELLCNRCNITLGKINDDVDLLQKMIDYLNKHKG